MNHFSTQKYRGVRLLSVAMVSTIMLIGCNKSENKPQSETINQDESGEMVPLVESPIQGSIEPRVDLIGCDDAVALVNLSQIIRLSISQQVHNKMQRFSQHTNTPIDFIAVDKVVNSILVDVVSSNTIKQPTHDGMQTCQASLSLTLPSEDINRASTLYAKLNEETLQQRIDIKNLTLNHNSIVDSAFVYVVGVQGGETRVKVAGHPEILNVVSDIMAKSQLKIAVDKKRIEDEKQEKEEALKRLQEQQEQNQRIDTDSGQISASPNSATFNHANGAPSKSDTDSDANSTKPKFSVPDDDSIKVVITEEEGTY